MFIKVIDGIYISIYFFTFYFFSPDQDKGSVVQGHDHGNTNPPDDIWLPQGGGCGGHGEWLSFNYCLVGLWQHYHYVLYSVLKVIMH